MPNTTTRMYIEGHTIDALQELIEKPVSLREPYRNHREYIAGLVRFELDGEPITTEDLTVWLENHGQ